MEKHEGWEGSSPLGLEHVHLPDRRGKGSAAVALELQGSPGETVGQSRHGGTGSPDVVAVAEAHACACGRGLPLLREIQGRTTDFVVAADGTVMHGLALIYVLRDQPGIQSFKVTQETRLLTRVELVTDATFDPRAIQRVKAGFRQRLGAQVEVQVAIVERIAAERSGKYRYIVSHALAPTP